MKKHFTGIALFIFIVGVSAFTASLFVEIPKVEVVEVKETVPVYKSRTKCSNNFENSSHSFVEAKINQAIYDKISKRLFTEIKFENANPAIESVSIKWHFFVKTADGTRYLGTENSEIYPVFEDKKDLVVRETLSFPLLKKMSLQENLYVMADLYSYEGSGKGRGIVGMRGSGTSRTVPDFDESKATAVLIADN